MPLTTNYIDSDREVISQKSEPNFDIDMELNASKKFQIQGIG